MRTSIDLLCYPPKPHIFPALPNLIQAEKHKAHQKKSETLLELVPLHSQFSKN